MYLTTLLAYQRLRIAFLHRCNQKTRVILPVLITHSPSSLILTHWLASSNSKSCSSSTRFAYALSFFRLRFRFLASHSGNGRAVPSPAIVYTGTDESVVSFILPASARQRCTYETIRTSSRTFFGGEMWGRRLRDPAETLVAPFHSISSLLSQLAFKTCCNLQTALSASCPKSRT